MIRKKRPNLTYNSKKTVWKWSTRKTIGYGLLSVIVILFLYRATSKTIENIRLAKYGSWAKAIVIDKQKVGGKGTIDFKVKYNVNGRQFENTTTNEPWNISDTVDILYLKSDPNVMRSYRFIKENYSTEIELK